MGAGMASMASAPLREPTLADFEVHSVVGEGEFGRVVLVSNRCARERESERRIEEAMERDRVLAIEQMERKRMERERKTKVRA